MGCQPIFQWPATNVGWDRNEIDEAKNSKGSYFTVTMGSKPFWKRILCLLVCLIVSKIALQLKWPATNLGWDRNEVDEAKNCLTTAWQLPNNCQITASWLPDNCLMTAWWPPDNCLQLPKNCLSTTWHLYDYCLMYDGKFQL